MTKTKAIRITVLLWLVLLTGWNMHLTSRMTANEAGDEEISKACGIALDD